MSRNNTREGTYSKLLKTSVLFADKPRLVSCCVLVVQIRNVYSRPTYITGGLESQFLSKDVEGILAAKLARSAETSTLSVVITLANV